MKRPLTFQRGWSAKVLGLHIPPFGASGSKLEAELLTIAVGVYSLCASARAKHGAESIQF